MKAQNQNRRQRWTINKAAGEFGVTRETITRHLKQSGVKVERGRTYTTREIHHALAGDLRFERTRLARCEANEAERNAKIQSGEMGRYSDIETALFQYCFGPLKQALDTMPDSLAEQLNPTDPAAAKKILSEWVATAKANIQVKIPKPPA